MEIVEIRVHPMAALYITTLENCIEAAAPMVREGYGYSECENAVRAAAIETFERDGTPVEYFETFMAIARTAFKILEKNRGDQA